MKKVIAALSLVFALFSSHVLANAAGELKARLAEVSTLHANFKQTVYSAGNKLVQDGRGELWLKRPNLFRWHLASPDESLLVSDGRTFWLYDPFVEQVTINLLKNVTDNTPFMLITRNSDNDWQKYTIQQSGDKFTLTPKAKSGDVKPFEITVNKRGMISSFVAKESDGQRSVYQLSGHSSSNISADKFTFTVPKGVTVDDQRQ